MTEEMVVIEGKEVALLNVEKAQQILSECKNVDEVKDIRDRAVAVATYLRVKKASTQARDDAFEIALRAERRMGQMLAEVEKNTGTRGQLIGKGIIGNSNTESPIKTLAEIGVTPKESSRAQRLAALPEQEFDGRIKAARAKEEKLTSARVLAVTSASDHDGDSWMTPAEYIEKARAVMGTINIDPASSEEANKIVKATRYCSKKDNGLVAQWFGNVWLNPPYSQPLIEQFVDKLLSSDVDRAVVLVNNSTDTGWFHKLFAFMDDADIICFPRGRLSFSLPGGKKVEGNRQGQAFFFFNCDPVAVVKNFSDVGVLLRK